VAAVAIAAVGLTGRLFIGAEPAGGSPVAARTAIVALGDSFASGEGGRWLGNGSDPFGTRSGTDRAAFDCGGWDCRYDPHRVYGESEQSGCHRSDVAPIRSAPIQVTEVVNLACSGARTSNLPPSADGGESLRGEPPQADGLAQVAHRADVRLIVVTVGANDTGFGEVVARCALDWARSDPADPRHCRRAAQAEIAATLPAMRAGLARALGGIGATMAAAGYARGEYRLVVIGYASPFPAGRWIRYPEDGWSRLRSGGCPIWNADADWAAGEATPAIDRAMKAAAARAGAEFLDLQHALDGHQLCDRRAHRVGALGPDPATAEWVRRLGFAPGALRESLHPDAYGQRAVGACIALHYARPPGDYACHATPGRSYADGMWIEPAGRGSG
jgi:lysophospholipase L1-like esterase